MAKGLTAAALLPTQLFGRAIKLTVKVFSSQRSYIAV
jgi:hypothetical protein